MSQEPSVCYSKMVVAPVHTKGLCLYRPFTSEEIFLSAMHLKLKKLDHNSCFSAAE